MTYRRTSAETWQSIQESGLVNRQKLRVYNFLYSHGPHTQSEINSKLRTGEVNPSYHKRLSELERMGLVAAAGERPCSITGRNCIQWITTDLSDPIPIPPPPPTKREVIVALEALLRDVSGWLEGAAVIGGDKATEAAGRIRQRVEEIGGSRCQ